MFLPGNKSYNPSSLFSLAAVLDWILLPMASYKQGIYVTFTSPPGMCAVSRWSVSINIHLQLLVYNPTRPIYKAFGC